MMSTTQQHRRRESIRRLGLCLAILMLFLVPQAAVMAPSSHTPAACACAPLPASEAELSVAAEHAAFAAVLNPDGRSGDDTFPLASPFAPSENRIVQRGLAPIAHQPAERACPRCAALDSAGILKTTPIPGSIKGVPSKRRRKP